MDAQNVHTSLPELSYRQEVLHVMGFLPSSPGIGRGLWDVGEQRAKGRDVGGGVTKDFVFLSGCVGN